MNLKQLKVFDWKEIWSGDLLDANDQLVFCTILMEKNEESAEGISLEVEIDPGGVKKLSN